MLERLGDEQKTGCRLCDVDHRRGSDECPAARVGKVVAGKYEIDALLGVGGMGAVYRARHQTLGTAVAVKMIHARYAANEGMARRFEQEAQRAASLRHPNIVLVSDLGRDGDGSPYLEMELLEGKPVDDLVRGGGLTPARAAALALQALDGLAFAHERGIVHRDLKPENMFVAESAAGEQVKIVDFGIAKALEGAEQGLTQTGSVMGTPLYMSPEQLTDSKKVDARSDIYSMGAAIFEMVTGTQPVKGDSLPEVMAKVLSGAITRRPREIRADLPEWLDEIIGKALARDPDDRFQSAAEMRAALKRALEAAPAQAGVASTLIGVGGAAGEGKEPLADPGLGPTLPPLAETGARPEALLRETAAREAAPREAAPPVAAAQTVAPAERAATPSRARLWIALGAGVTLLAAGAAWIASGSADPPPAEQPDERDLADRGDPPAPPPPPPAPPGMALVPGGELLMGSTPEEIDEAYSWCRELAGDECRRDLYEREQPAREVKVSSFFLDVHEVTNRELADWLDRLEGLEVRADRQVFAAGVGLVVDLHPAHGGVERRGDRYQGREGRESHPATQVTWLAARRYCEDRGARLPTEAEWELAARGAGRRTFVWGEEREPDCDRVVYARADELPCADRPRGAAAVGSAAADRTPAGIHDLGGNVAEWVEDAFAPRYEDCAPGGCQDPVREEPVDGEVERVARGGTFDGHAEALRAAGRARFAAGAVLHNVGFRCALSAPAPGEETR